MERAFALAENGTALTMDDLHQFLGREGFSAAEMRQLHGRVMQKQLLARMAVAKAAKES